MVDNSRQTVQRLDKCQSLLKCTGLLLQTLHMIALRLNSQLRDRTLLQLHIQPALRRRALSAEQLHRLIEQIHIHLINLAQLILRGL